MSDEVRVEIVAGGMPTPEQLAAVVVALTPPAAPPAAPATPAPGGWLRAALLEGVGMGACRTPGDVTPLP